MQYTREKIEKAFDTIYKKRGKRYGSTKEHFPQILDYIYKNVERESTVLDAGCGRARLVKELYENEYDVEGTEFCAKALQDKGEMEIKPIWYEDFDQIKSDSYDVVVSTEVLQHLQTTEEMIKALKNLVRITKKYLIISISAGHCRHLELNGLLRWNELNLINYPKAKWLTLFEEQMHIDVIHRHKRSVLVMGRIKDLEQEETPVEEETPADPLLKKKRGRPKKIKTEEPAIESVSPKKKRGRPRKVKVEEPVIEPVVEEPVIEEKELFVPLIIDNPPKKIPEDKDFSEGISDIDYALDNMAEYLDADEEDEEEEIEEEEEEDD